MDSSRSYIDDLYSDDDSDKVQESLVCLKNVVIGSDKQKSLVISQGIVPRLMILLSQDITPQPIRYDAAIVLGMFFICFFFTAPQTIQYQQSFVVFFFIAGSLSKGSDENVRSLIEAGLIQVLLSIVTNPISDKYLMEICLCVVRSIYEHPFAPKEIINTNAATLNYLIGKCSKNKFNYRFRTNELNDFYFIRIGLASPENTIQCQTCVANILVPVCHNSNDQKMLSKAGAIPLLARLITSRYTVLQIPALKCLAAMCFTNKFVSDMVCATR